MLKKLRPIFLVLVLIGSAFIAAEAFYVPRCPCGRPIRCEKIRGPLVLPDGHKIELWKRYCICGNTFNMETRDVD